MVLEAAEPQIEFVLSADNIWNNQGNPDSPLGDYAFLMPGEIVVDEFEEIGSAFVVSIDNRVSATDVDDSDEIVVADEHGLKPEIISLVEFSKRLLTIERPETLTNEEGGVLLEVEALNLAAALARRIYDESPAKSVVEEGGIDG